MKSVHFQLEASDSFFSKTDEEKKQMVADATGLSIYEIELRWLTLDTKSHEAVIFYEVDNDEED